jgi:hemolysin III
VPAATAIVAAPDIMKPALRGVSHQYAFFVALACIAPLVVAAEGARAVVGASVYAASVAAMFGASALYHRGSWSDRARSWLRRLDHAAAFGLIAGTYTVYGLLALEGAWTWAILSVVWGCALAAVLVRAVWVNAPNWVAGAFAVGIGWVGMVAFPLILGALGIAGTMLTLAGGLIYTVGAVVYVRQRPDPRPHRFGFHEVFHALVIAAVGLQYGVVAFILLP